MKRVAMAILIFDLMAGLLFWCVYRNHRQGTGDVPADAARGTKSVVTEPKEDAPGDLEEKKIALTFDDGPHPYYTEQLLDGLRDRGVVATFFVTGEHAKLHPDVIKRMQEEGHLIGNHTYSHIQLTKSNREKFKEELVATNEVLEEITGEEVEFVRPPYGSWDKSFEKELNMFPVLWTVDPLDWSSRNVSSITEKIVNKAGENDIILMHDYYETSVTAALKVVDELLEEGYTFVTVEEILFD
ncbi:MAG: polysaccharide deacetylase family protein [Clostridium sp.]|nr:polysaccharide deacetylase family protein [Acetatifactor muris]MCM1526923.1 polysaccharide deacetylase family protein [Bacteroides sp.]MCM1563283.1 polysaccharide deacetylase family protein [Clostridium sp.]